MAIISVYKYGIELDVGNALWSPEVVPLYLLTGGEVTNVNVLFLLSANDRTQCRNILGKHPHCALVILISDLFVNCWVPFLNIAG